MAQPRLKFTPQQVVQILQTPLGRSYEPFDDTVLAERAKISAKYEELGNTKIWFPDRGPQGAHHGPGAWLYPGMSFCITEARAWWLRNNIRGVAATMYQAAEGSLEEYLLNHLGQDIPKLAVISAVGTPGIVENVTWNIFPRHETLDQEYNIEECLVTIRWENGEKDITSVDCLSHVMMADQNG